MASPVGDEVRAFAPATVANLGPGFDVLGLALVGPGDTVTARRVDGQGVRLVSVSGADLPLDPERNTASVAAAATLRKAGVDVGVEIELEKGLPIGSGMGSSAASAAAAALATNLLLGGPLRKRELIGPCVEAEGVVAGRHADNVAPALLGGLILVRRVDPVDVVRVPVPSGLQIVVVTPELVVETKAARSVLPTQVPLQAMVRTAADVSALLAACYTGDLELFARCVVDEVVAPRRAALIPGVERVVAAALDAGALGSSISGSGPSVFAFCRSDRHGVEVAAAMVAAFGEEGIPATSVVSPADCPGARRV